MRPLDFAPGCHNSPLGQGNPPGQSGGSDGGGNIFFHRGSQARESEVVDLILYRQSEISDDNLAIEYLLPRGDWDRLAARLLTMRRNLDIMAGYVSHLLPSVPAGDVPKTEEVEIQ